MKLTFISRCTVALLALIISGARPVPAAKNGNKARANAQMAQRMQQQQQRQVRQQQSEQRARQMQNQRRNAQDNPQTADDAPRGKKRNKDADQTGKEKRKPGKGQPVRNEVADSKDAPPLVQTRQQVAEAAKKIDILVADRLREAGQSANPLASDEQFLRRVYVDAAGRIPTADEATKFLASNAPDKRAQLIDALLISDGHASQSFNWLADMLRVKDKIAKGGPAFAYEEWLKERIAKNAPWNETVSQMMTASGSLTTNGPTGYLLRDAGMPLDNLSNTLTTFLGANVACAQCHDHPLAPWTQRQFFEMAGFFSDVDAKVQPVGGVVRKVLKQSKVLTDTDKGLLQRLAAANSSQVRVVPGKSLKFPADYKYDDAKPGSLVHPALFSWTPEDKKSAAYQVDVSDPSKKREAFAKWLTHPDNPRFALTIANRLWQKNFGVAVQEPISDLDDLSKASNPALLVHLGGEMKRLNFDLREFQRVLFNSQTYQRRASVTPDLGKGPYLFAGPVLRRMTSEQAWDSVLTLVIGIDLDLFKLRRAQALQQFVIPGKTPSLTAIEEKAIALRGMKLPKDGVMVNYETDSGSVAPPRFAGMILARASELEQPSKDSHFLRMFGQGDRELADDSSREGGIPQVLMLMNGDAQTVLAHPEALAMKKATLAPREGQIESLYLSYLGRRPTAAEKTKVMQAIAQGMKLPELTWVLFNTREFIFVQ